MATIISKDDAAALTAQHYTWERNANSFISQIDSVIRDQAYYGQTEVTIDVPNYIVERSLNMALEKLNEAGYTDVEVNEYDTPMSLTIKWSDTILASIAPEPSPVSG